jgi:hypothetical protein
MNANTAMAINMKSHRAEGLEHRPIMTADCLQELSTFSAPQRLMGIRERPSRVMRDAKPRAATTKVPAFSTHRGIRSVDAKALAHFVERRTNLINADNAMAIIMKSHRGGAGAPVNND